MHVSADERYELFLDGRRIGRGSEYGSVDNWYFETYNIPISRGHHTIIAKVWSLGSLAPHAQMSLRHGFIFAPEGKWIDSLGTGTSEWEYKRIEGIGFRNPLSTGITPYWGTGANLIIDGGKYPWGIEKGEGDGWSPVDVLQAGTNGHLRNGAHPSHLMRPAVLPSMVEKEVKNWVVRFVSQLPSFDTTAVPVRQQDNLNLETSDWALSGGKTVTIPPKTCKRVIIDLKNYYCAYPELCVSGGRASRIELLWAESLFNEPKARTKGNRNEIEGKFFRGIGDVFIGEGGERRTYRTLWWRAGRYLQLVVETQDNPLTIEGLTLQETRYPLEMESTFESNDPRPGRVIPLAFRGLQMCAHELYFDCPYYEQLMYSGDTRLQMLATLITTRDDRLPRKAIEVFDYSRLPSGLTRSQYPGQCLQIIAPFSLAWIGMVYDYALWRGDWEFIRQRMPGVRNVLEAFLTFRNRDGLIGRPPGWNFIDWVPEWNDGVPPGAEYGPNGIINWQVVYTLKLAAQLEDWMHEAELKKRWDRLADEIARRAITVFWDGPKGLFSDDLNRMYFSEHAQCLAVLSGVLDSDKVEKIAVALKNEKEMARTTISFTHYLFETYRQLNLTDSFFQRLNLWFDLESQGFKTTPEQPEPSRSDCHGWGSHSIYHFFATILGIRPASMGFGAVEIDPKPGDLKRIAGKLVHPEGWIEMDLTAEMEHLTGSVVLPQNVQGVIKYANRQIPLSGGGRQSISL